MDRQLKNSGGATVHLQDPQHDEMDFASAILATVRGPMLVLDMDLRVTQTNFAFFRLFCVSPEDVIGRPLSELGNRQWDIPALHSQLKTVLQQEHTFEDFEVEHGFQDIGVRTMLLNARRVDHLRLILLAIEDVTDRRRLEHQQRAVTAELAHRLKNVLAVVQSIATQTTADSVEEYRSALNGRVKALAVAHGVLIEAQSQWQDIELRTLIERALAPHVGLGGKPRIQFDGPDVRLTSGQATSFALILHELATNAAKYGALSNSSGDVSITWSVASNHLHVDWTERNGPTVTATPSEGFGARLVKGMASYQFGGNANLRFEAPGLRCELELPLTRE